MEKLSTPKVVPFQELKSGLHFELSTLKTPPTGVPFAKWVSVMHRVNSLSVLKKKEDVFSPVNWTHLGARDGSCKGGLVAIGCRWLCSTIIRFSLKNDMSFKRELTRVLVRVDLPAGHQFFLRMPVPCKRLLDLEGQPLSNVVVYVDNLQKPDPVKIAQAFEKSSRELLGRATAYRHGQWRFVN